MYDRTSVALGTIACALCHCFGQAATKHTSMPVLVDANVDDSESQYGLFSTALP